MEGKIDMAARRQVTNKLRGQYRRACKADKTKILDRVVATTGMGRSTARRMLAGPPLPHPASQVDRRRLRPRGFSDDARALCEHVWALMGMPCGKYLVVMLQLWLPLLAAAGDLARPFATEAALAELQAMSAATVDRYLKPARDRMAIKGISTTKPSPLLRNSIAIRTCAEQAPKAPGLIEADTVAHCGPSLIGEFARALTMTDLVCGWTENRSIRNNASTWILQGIQELAQRFPFPMAIFDSDCGAEFINHEVAAWLQARDIAQTRSRPYQKNDQAHVESKNNHVVRKHAFYRRYDTGEELELLNRLWDLVSLRLNFFTPTKKAIGYTTTAKGRRRRVYDKPATPWQRLQASGVLDAQQLSDAAARVEGINPADLTRQINAIQMQLLDLAKAKTEALAAARHVDLQALDPAINRLTKAK
ncbi:transposase family protein [Mycobacterium sp. SM1]|uniref:integrase catalytic domain-containing protein n=1 Tax=Mycobacterium sp. SM1 TaxID=2816243 RepID=UPI001BCDF702|nr:DDE-type integrase/transposase/recombinase [Mycobacterium sp. SM1]MBS4728153.1 transposase family protein [Mycobacterium sp. SM1]